MDRAYAAHVASLVDTRTWAAEISDPTVADFDSDAAHATGDCLPADKA
jgi:hypothetical protein